MATPYRIPYFSSPQEATLYFSSLRFTYQHINELTHPIQNMFFPYPTSSLSIQHSYLPIKNEAVAQRPTDARNQDSMAQDPVIKVEVKAEQNVDQQQNIGDQQQVDKGQAHSRVVKQKNLKKNTESNLINNVFSYICSQNKSYRTINQLVGDRADRKAIFYIFASNLKRLNGKYVNRKNIKEICEIVPKQKHFKMLSKSIKRLKILSMAELRVILRKLIFSYLRGPESILPLLTSKKICKVSFRQHMNRRRNLVEFVKTMLQDYN